ncbi:MAG: PKD domain-containing protein [Bacteroidetes bacterium]|nr:PKD domain-containing protein [Bacteroidota bacterium]
MKTNFFFLVFAFLVIAIITSTSAQTSSVTVAVKNNPSSNSQITCGFDAIREQTLKENPTLFKEIIKRENLLQESVQQKENVQRLSSNDMFYIPVVVHLVAQPGNGVDQVTAARVIEQINVMNTMYRNTNSKPVGVLVSADAKIQFCLAQTLPGGMAGWSNVNGVVTPGIMKYTSTETTHQYNQVGQNNLRTLSAAFNPSNYLNIYVVNSIPSGSGVIAGYSDSPINLAPGVLDGIVIDSRFFGGTTSLAGSVFPDHNQGKVIVHEAGHYFGLYHVFEGGCTAPDDRVNDTPPTNENGGCPTPQTVNSCTIGTFALTENYMDYTNSNCWHAYTPGQRDRMHSIITTFRSNLVSASNLIASGINCIGLNAGFSITNSNPCINTSVTFDAVASGAGLTYNWDFGDGGTSTGDPSNHPYAAAGNYKVTLRVSDGTNTITSIQNVYVSTCTLTNPSQANWYFGNYGEVSFAQGFPQPQANAFSNNTIQNNEACASVSNAAGNLLFYTDSRNVWNSNHQLINPGNPMLGGSSAEQGALIVPDRGIAGRYYLFTLFAQDVLSSRFEYSILNSVPGNTSFASKDVAINLPATGYSFMNGAIRTGEGITAIPHCNGTDYWIITTSGTDFLVYRLSSTGLTFSGSYSTLFTLSQYTEFNMIKASPDGNRIAIGIQYTGTRIFNFNKSSGTISNPILITNNGVYGLSFSPNSRVLYSLITSSQPQIFQYDLSVSNPSLSQKLVSGILGENLDWKSIQIAPDNKLYVSMGYRLGMINFPDIINSANLSNECGFNPMGPFLNTPPAGGSTQSTSIYAMWGLPNMIDAKLTGQIPLDFTYVQSNCNTFAFTPNTSCATSYSWDFGDGTFSSLQAPSHTFSSFGLYPVRLTINGGTSVLKYIGVSSLSSPQIAGAKNCISSSKLFYYSIANYNSSLNYQWLITGGSINGLTNGPNVSVSWTSTAGTISVTVTDPKTGCTSSANLNVTNQPPVISAGSNKIICGTPNLTNNYVTIGTNPVGNSYNYSWTPSIGLSCINCAEPKAAPPSTRSYTLTAKDNTTGCTAKSTVLVTVSSKPTADAGPSYDLYKCIGSTIYIGTGPAVSGHTYSWSSSFINDLSCTNCPSPSVGNNYNNRTYPVRTYTLTVSNSNGCTATDKITVRFLDFAWDNSVIVNAGTDQSVPCGSTTNMPYVCNQPTYTSWSTGYYPALSPPLIWQPNCAMNAPQYSTTLYTLYTQNLSNQCMNMDQVLVTVTGICNNSMIQPIKQPINSSIEKYNFFIYPNPSNGLMQFNYTLEKEQSGELQITDILGKMVASYKLSEGENTLQINETQLINSIYLYRLLVDSELVKTDKISIIH